MRASTVSRKPSCCYIADDEDDDGCGPDRIDGCDPSLDAMEAGFSAVYRYSHLSSRSSGSPWGSFGNGYLGSGGGGSVSSPRFGGTRYEEEREPHFLDSCFLCRKPLRNNKDIFMYRGDTPFCSEDCRQEQIEVDQERERNTNLSSSMRALRNKERRRSTSPSESPDPRLRTDAVAVV